MDEARGFKSSEDYANFMQALGVKEKKARRKGEGLWEGHMDEALWWKVARYWRRTFGRNNSR